MVSLSSRSGRAEKRTATLLSKIPCEVQRRIVVERFYPFEGEFCLLPWQEKARMRGHSRHPHLDPHVETLMKTNHAAICTFSKVTLKPSFCSRLRQRFVTA